MSFWSFRIPFRTPHSIYQQQSCDFRLFLTTIMKMPLVSGDLSSSMRQFGQVVRHVQTVLQLGCISWFSCPWMGFVHSRPWRYSSILFHWIKGLQEQSDFPFEAELFHTTHVSDFPTVDTLPSLSPLHTLWEKVTMYSSHWRNGELCFNSLRIKELHK